MKIRKLIKTSMILNISIVLLLTFFIYTSYAYFMTNTSGYVPSQMIKVVIKNTGTTDATITFESTGGYVHNNLNNVAVKSGYSEITNISYDEEYRKTPISKEENLETCSTSSEEFTESVCELDSKWTTLISSDVEYDKCTESSTTTDKTTCTATENRNSGTSSQTNSCTA